MGEINASDKIMFEDQKKRENMKIKDIFFYVKFHLRDRLDRIHSLLRRADARGSADISYRI